MPAGLSSPMLDFFRRGDVARDVRMLAAQGAIAPRPLEQLGLLMLLSKDHANAASAVRDFLGRKYDYTARNLFEERYVNYVSTMEAERIRNDVVMSALKGLIIKMGGLRDGRKSLILVSEGFTNSLPDTPVNIFAADAGETHPLASVTTTV